MYTKVQLMDTLWSGRCMLVNYSRPLRKGASVRLSLEPSHIIFRFTTHFISDMDLSTAAMDNSFDR